MKKSELKSILKPLVKECIKEALFEEGILSSIISEVATGLKTTEVSTSPTSPPKSREPVLERMQQNAFGERQSEKLHGHKQKLMAAIGGETYNGVNLFEGTAPATGESSPSQQASPMSGQSPGDAGVDISNLFGSVGTHWNAHMTDVGERK